MKVKSIKNLENFSITVECQSAIKGGNDYWSNSPLGGGGSRPMRPTMATMSTFILP